MKNSFILMTSVYVLCAMILKGTVVAQENVTFSTKILKNGVIDQGAGSMNLCWLLDSDLNRPRNTSNQERIVQMGCGSLRFPYGHLADNYLWDTPPFGGILEPRVATMEQAPGKFEWATHPDGTFQKDMDFDEFMGMCDSTNAEPLVVVNVLSFKYKNGPGYDTLKTTAVEWVRYAKSKGYQVAYWQIGNEVDHHQDILTKSEYVSLYIDFVSAMKAEDPSINCGPGILSNTGYFNTLMAEASDKVDFTSCHQYLWAKSWNDYYGWRDSPSSDMANHIKNMQNAVNIFTKPNMSILVTESNTRGCWEDDSLYTYKGLAWFDLLFEEQQYEDVKYTYMWNSHSPWKGEFAEGSDANAWWNNGANELTPQGWPLYILNNTAEERYMVPDGKMQGLINCYGSYTPSTGNMTLYLMNKALSPDSINVTLNNYYPDRTYERWEFKGADPWDKHPDFLQTGEISFTENGFSAILPPCALVVLKLAGYTSNTGFGSSMSANRDNKHLMQVYPNPVYELSTVYYQIPEDSRMVLKIIDNAGKVVDVLRDDQVSRGSYSDRFDSSKLQAGIYFANLHVEPLTGNSPFTLTRKIIL